MQNLSSQINNSTSNVQTSASMQHYTPANVAPTYVPVGQTASPLQSSGVNIVIYNPSVNPTAGTVANSNNTYGTPMAYPQNYYTQPSKQPPSEAVAQAYLANSSIKDEVKTNENVTAQKTDKTKEETHKANIVQLTDDYVKTLENYLNNQNPKVREMGVKELFERFKEHKSRYNDVALTNLLNKALQDASKNVRFIALTALDSGYAQGDNLTREILNKMQASKDVFGEDALLASEALLKMAGNKVEVEVAGPKPETKKDSDSKK